MTTVENIKLVACDVRDGVLISQHPPTMEGVEWVEVPETRTEAGSYFQYVAVARVPESQVQVLPNHCWVDDRYVHVTKLNIQSDGLEVCHQAAEGHRIEAAIY